MNATMESSTRQNGTQPYQFTDFAEATVLLVEDEPAVRQVTRAVLEIGGYRVLEADGPAAAEHIASNVEIAIDLLLTDVVMPGMNGAELARRLASRAGDAIHDRICRQRGVATGDLRVTAKTYPKAVYCQRPAGASGRRASGAMERPRKFTSSALPLPLISPPRGPGRLAREPTGRACGAARPFQVVVHQRRQEYDAITPSVATACIDEVRCL